MIADDGVEGTSLRKIAARAGVPLGSLTYYFDGREDLITEAFLRFTDLPIEKIGQECGMSDANYFSRVFKKTEGVAPGEYRKAWRM